MHRNGERQIKFDQENFVENILIEINKIENQRWFWIKFDLILSSLLPMTLLKAQNVQIVEESVL